MLRILKSLALFHWAALFSLLTTLCVFADPAAIAAALGRSGVGSVEPVLAHLAKGLLATGLALCACLFAWSALSALLAANQRAIDDTVSPTAFATASALLASIAALAIFIDFDLVAPAVALAASVFLATYLMAKVNQRASLVRVSTLRRSAASVAATLARLSQRQKPQPTEAW